MSYSQKYLPSDIISTDPDLATQHFVLNDDHMIISRTDYTVLTYIGDVGALLGTLQLISGVILVNVLQINILAENDMLNSVFRLRRKHHKTDHFKLTYCEWLCREIPRKYLLGCYFKKRERSHYLREIGNRRIERQLDMVHFLRQQMALKAIIRAKSTKVERKLARRNYALALRGNPDEVGTTSSSSSGNETDFR